MKFPANTKVVLLKRDSSKHQYRLILTLSCIQKSRMMICSLCISICSFHSIAIFRSWRRWWSKWIDYKIDLLRDLIKCLLGHESHIAQLAQDILQIISLWDNHIIRRASAQEERIELNVVSCRTSIEDLCDVLVADTFIYKSIQMSIQDFQKWVKTSLSSSWFVL